MSLSFLKYHGTGNDFLLLDNRDGALSLTNGQVARLCHRRFGVGADGLMLLERSADADFRMVYYNSDGNQSTMCGNGGRCIAAFAYRLGVCGAQMRFEAVDGPHEATVHPDGTVSLSMGEVRGVRADDGYWVLDTGSPHYVAFSGETDWERLMPEGRRIRHLAEFAPGGLNVNFIRRDGGVLEVDTYERGVEDMTYSCGTGVVASAIVASGDRTGPIDTRIRTRGGTLLVSFERTDGGEVRNVVLRGPAEFVFSGVAEL